MFDFIITTSKIVSMLIIDWKCTNLCIYRVLVMTFMITTKSISQFLFILKEVKFLESGEQIKKETWPEVVAGSQEVPLQEKEAFICLESYNWLTKDASIDLIYMLCFSSVHSAAIVDSISLMPWYIHIKPQNHVNRIDSIRIICQ